MGLFTYSWTGDTSASVASLQRAFQDYTGGMNWAARALHGGPVWGPLPSSDGGIFADTTTSPRWSGRITVTKKDAPAYCDVMIWDEGETRRIVIDTHGAPVAAGYSKGIGKELTKLIGKL